MLGVVFFFFIISFFFSFVSLSSVQSGNHQSRFKDAVLWISRRAHFVSLPVSTEEWSMHINSSGPATCTKSCPMLQIQFVATHDICSLPFSLVDWAGITGLDFSTMWAAVVEITDVTCLDSSTTVLKLHYWSDSMYLSITAYAGGWMDFFSPQWPGCISWIQLTVNIAGMYIVYKQWRISCFTSRFLHICTGLWSFKRSNSSSYLAFNLITRYQSTEDLLHVIHSNCICLECNILSFPISSTFNHALLSETWRPRAAAGYTLHRDCVIIASHPKP